MSSGVLGDEARIHKYYIAPKDETYYEEYKKAIMQVIKEEEHLTEMPVIYNINIGHAKPTGILPIGIETEIDCDKKTIRFLESPTI